MLCEQAETLLALFALDEMEPGPRAELEKHLDSCAACREKLGDIRVTVGLLQEAVARQPVARLTDERRAALLKQVAEEEKAGARSRPAFRLVRRIGARLKESFAETRFGWGAAAACVLILLILAGLMLPALSRARERAYMPMNTLGDDESVSMLDEPLELELYGGLPAAAEASPAPSASPFADSPVRGGDLTRSKENLERRGSFAVNGLGTTGEHPGGATGGGLLADGRIWHDFDVDDASNSAGGDSLKSKTEYWAADVDSWIAADKSGRKSGDMAGEAGKSVALVDGGVRHDPGQDVTLYYDGHVKWQSTNLSSNEATDDIIIAGQSWGAGKDAVMWDGTDIAKGATPDEAGEESKRDQIIALAKAEAESIRSGGDAEAARYYDALKQDPDSAVYLRNVRELRDVMTNGATVIVDPKTPSYDFYASSGPKIVIRDGRDSHTIADVNGVRNSKPAEEGQAAVPHEGLDLGQGRTKLGFVPPGLDLSTGTSAFSSAQQKAPQAETEGVAKKPEGSIPVLAHVPLLRPATAQKPAGPGERDGVSDAPASTGTLFRTRERLKAADPQESAAHYLKSARQLLGVLEAQNRSIAEERVLLAKDDYRDLNYERAMEDVQAALKVAPNHKEALKLRTELQALLKLDEGGKAPLELGSTVNVRTSQVRGELDRAIERGRLYKEAGEYDKALQQFELAEEAMGYLRPNHDIQNTERRLGELVKDTRERKAEDENVRLSERLNWPDSTVESPAKTVWDKIVEREKDASVHAQKTQDLIEGRTESERAEKAAGGRDEEQDKMYVVLTPEDTASIDKRPSRLVPTKSLTKAAITEPVAAPEPDVKKIEEDLPAPVFKAVPVNPWVMSSEDALSTFGIDVDTASYSIARGYIRRGYLPPPASVRMEEFVNAFDYNYSWNHDRVFTTHVEAAPAPFGRGLTLVKVGIRGKVIGRDGRKPVHLVFVVDASGSMARTDRIPLVQYALKQLVSALDPADTISLVIYNTRASLVLETVPVARKDAIISAIDAIRCGGSTNLYEGLKLGYGVAARGFRTGGVNRVILCSDGVANVGSDDADEMLANVESFREQGIAFTAAGIGSGAYNDVLMERLADRGDGNYVFVDSEAEAHRVFVEDMAATLQTIAKDVKIQVAFDPARVRRYRLIGFENRDIADADFRNDAVDAGEIGSGQSATALYEVELLPPVADEAVNDLGTVYVRYRDLETDKVEEISHRIESGVVRSRAVAESPRFYLAACAAEFAEILRESEHAADGNLDKVRSVMERVAIQLPLDKRVQELLWMVRTAKGLPKAE